MDTKNPAQQLRDFMNRVVAGTNGKQAPARASSTTPTLNKPVLSEERDTNDFSHLMDLTEGERYALEGIKNRDPKLYKKIVGLE